MDVIDFEQLPQHDFDLGVRDMDGSFEENARALFQKYGELIMGSDQPEITLGDFEKLLVGLITSRTEGRALLNELNFTTVCPADAAGILSQSIVPTDEILDSVAKLRGPFDTAVEDYAQQLAESEYAMVAPEGEQLPSDEETETARLRLARYVITSVLVDDREECQL
ncbi:hypothetical protein pEaSNUABM6_00125 [Erwinia phage pEa_SNUABM_6]|nr:hypothetical protein pEaSNUABM6_00125 [Erwinia phage pEa_SNUABM_6]